MSRQASPAVSLRLADDRDAYSLWLWANDPDTRRGSFSCQPIPWSEHRAWLQRALASPEIMVLVAVLSDDLPAGVVRFDTQDQWCRARLSYTVAPEQRGCGLARPLLSAGVRAVRASHPAVDLCARVSDANEPSLRAFRGLPEWTECERTEPGVVTFHCLGSAHQTP